MTENCSESRIKTASALRGELEQQEMLELKKHLASCAECMRAYEELRALDSILSAAPVAELRPDALERVRARISRRRAFVYRYAIAAAAAAAIVVACVIFLMPRNSTENRPAAEIKKSPSNEAVALKHTASDKNAPIPEQPAATPDNNKEKAVADSNPIPEEAPKAPEKSVEPIAPAPKENVAAVPETDAPEKTAKNPEVAPAPMPESPVKTPETPKADETVVSKPADAADNKAKLTEAVSEGETEFEPLALSTTALEGAVYFSGKSDDKPVKLEKGSAVPFGSTVSTKISSRACVSSELDLLVAMNVNTDVAFDCESSDRVVVELKRGEVMCVFTGFERPLVLKTPAGEFSTSFGSFTARIKSDGEVYVSALEGTVAFAGKENAEQGCMTRCVYRDGKCVRKQDWVALISLLSWGKKVIPPQYLTMDQPKPEVKGPGPLDKKNGGDGWVKPGQPNGKSGGQPGGEPQGGGQQGGGNPGPGGGCPGGRK
jgi:ferric-dicitrate binding protein FerR (iron transport regulator)